MLHFAYCFTCVQAQYVFIHDSLSELVMCGETEVAAANFRITMTQLRKQVAGDPHGITGFLKQFQVHYYTYLLYVLHIVQRYQEIPCTSQAILSQYPKAIQKLRAMFIEVRTMSLSDMLYRF